MDTTTSVHLKDASSMDEVPDESVQLIVTSPPYPMIEMWDDQFRRHDPVIGDALDSSDGQEAFDRMHQQLREVWQECARVLQAGGIACVNVGDATRKIGGDFQLFPNHVHITHDLLDLGLTQLPGILWRKPTNSAAKFMGSGMLGLNAYVTLEHEHILVFRKGGTRTTSGDETDARRESAYFWEERNRWFSDVWTDLKGVRQGIDPEHQELRTRSGAFPLELPLRLIEMYSVYGDTVLDPFWGTGTTSLAAAMTRRNSIGYEIEEAFYPVFEERLEDAPALSSERNAERLESHQRFLEERRGNGKSIKHENDYYGVGVISAQERDLKLYDLKSVQSSGRSFHFTYEPHLIQKNLFAGEH
jgi:DNA modification methylase